MPDGLLLQSFVNNNMIIAKPGYSDHANAGQ